MRDRNRNAANLELALEVLEGDPKLGSLERLLRAGALHDAILSGSHVSSIVTDTKGLIRIFNAGARRMLGYEPSEVQGTVALAGISDPLEVGARAKALSAEHGSVVHPGFEALVFRAMRGMEDIYELSLVSKDGERVPAVVSATPLKDAAGAVAGYLFVCTDNAARRLAETERLRLLESQQKMDMQLQHAIRDHAALIQAVLNTVVDGIITFHADDGIIETVNPAAEQIFGYSAEELIGQNCIMLIPDTDRDHHKSFPAYYRTGDEPYAIGIGREVSGRRKDGSIFPMEVAMSEMWLQGERHYTGIFRDITERHHMNKVLHENYIELKRAIAVAEKANLAKSEFLSRMSHELRTPLNAILGFAQLLESGSPQPTAAQSERLHQITEAGWYLLELINEILDLAVIESGKLSLSPEPVSLADVLQECQAMIESQAQKRGIQLNFRPFDHTLFANTDRTRVKQVLINLLSNAIKYNSRHGTVEVECMAVSPERVRISIRDTGAGLAPNVLSQLFQPFNRLGQENGPEEGTGMGLVVAKQLVELMGGAIGVESAPGKGSKFWVELIRDVAPQYSAGNPVPAGFIPHVLRYATPRTLLYVEDNPANLMLIEQIIGSFPHVRMLSARDAHIGLALARAHLPDVILMDINLPGISGTEALRMLREDPTTGHIPVLALSANAMPRDIERGLEAGFFRYLTKPVKLNEFTVALNDALNLPRIGPFNDSRTGMMK